MKWLRTGNLRLGSNIVELLLPQRRPFLMVDFVDSYAPGSKPVLEAGRNITANEAYFDGHFPGLHLWPGTLTIEGLGQSATLLIILTALHRKAAEHGDDFEAVLNELRNLDLGFRLHPGYRPDPAPRFVTLLTPFRHRLAVGTSAEVKFLRPVFAGQRLDYRVVLSEDFGDMVRFEVEACVGDVTVATGVMKGSRVHPPALPHTP